MRRPRRSSIRIGASHGISTHIGSAHDDAGLELLKAAARRRLAPITIHNYCLARRTVHGGAAQPTQVSVSLLDAGLVTAFMVEYCRDRNTNSAKSMARSVRSFLRLAHATGRTSAELWGAVPSSSGWHLASLPRSVPGADLERLLAVDARSRFTATGRRDYAILLLLALAGESLHGAIAEHRLDLDNEVLVETDPVRLTSHVGESRQGTRLQQAERRT